MLYIVIIAFIGVFAFPISISYREWDVGADFALICLFIAAVGSSILYLSNCGCDRFERKVVSTSTKETKKLIYPLDMSARKPHKYFIIPRKDDAYHLYVKTKTGFEQTEYDIDETKLKQCNE